MSPLNLRIKSSIGAQLLGPGNCGTPAPRIGWLVENQPTGALKAFSAKIVERTTDVLYGQTACGAEERCANHRIASRRQPPGAGQIDGRAARQIQARQRVLFQSACRVVQRSTLAEQAARNSLDYRKIQHP